MTLKIGQVEVEAVKRHAEREYPNECCGVLVGTAGEEMSAVTKVVSCRNTKIETSTSEFEIDPAELIAVQREVRAEGLSVVGFYHSHPEHPARWSPKDLEQAHWTGCSYLIVSVSNGVAKEMASFRLTAEGVEKRFREEPIVS